MDTDTAFTVMKKYNDYFSDHDFNYRYNQYENLDLQILKKNRPLCLGSIGPGRKCSFEIIPLEFLDTIYNRGFMHIRCDYQYLIESIELEIGNQQIFRVENPNGLIFPILREMVGCDDDGIIPCFGSDNFIPYLYNETARIQIQFKLTFDDIELTEQMLNLTYEEVEIMNDDVANVFQGVFYTKLINSSPKVISMLEFTTPCIETNDKIITVCAHNKFKLNFNLITKSILVYVTNNSIKKCTFKGCINDTEILKIEMKEDQIKDNIGVIDFAPNLFLDDMQNYGLMLNKFKICQLDLELVEQKDAEQEVYIYGIGLACFRICNGVMISYLM